MKIKTLVISALLLSAPICAQADTFLSWNEWIGPVVSNVSPREIQEFRAKLPKIHLEDFDRVGKDTQALSVVLFRGMESQAKEFPFNPYAKAFKMANKMEVGYFMDLVFRRLDYNAK